MGTRADFYVGRGKEAKWIGSIGLDGYPDGIPEEVLTSKTPEGFAFEVWRHIKEDRHGTMPEQGWPWPWEDSTTTDYAYSFEDGKIYCSNFGRKAFIIGEEKEPEHSGPKCEVFPDMTAQQNFTMGERSGMIVVTGPG